MEKNNFTRSFKAVVLAKNILLLFFFIFFLTRIAAANETYQRYPSGQIKSEIVGSGPEKGSTTTYFENGQKQTELLYLDGRKNVYTEWFESGSKKEQVHYKDGEPSKMQVWSAGGPLESVSTFASDGTRSDIFYYPSGIKKSQQSSKGRSPAGTWTKWSPDGQKTFEKVYEDKEEVENLSDENDGYFPDQKAESKTPLDDALDQK